ncbi:MAG: hypothetical protein K9G44_10090, partial [Melioribacteraceae bacterium]|nr:hypothetical protein [Melioribacteraceae bacterium]
MKEYNNDQFSSDEKSLKDYLILIRTNILPILLIALTGLIVSIIYATNAIDIYSSTTAIKIAKPSGSILSSPLMPEFNDWGSDRFIANEIEILKSYTLREKIAQRIINEVEAGNVNIDELSKVLDNQAFLTGSEKTLLNQTQITGVLALVGIEQKRGLDIVEISFESPSPEEAAWIPNIYTQAYSDLNLEFNREQVNNVKSFLEEQRTEKLDDLVQAENDLKNYQELGQIFSLDNQAQQLIDQLSEFESKKYENELEYNISTQRLEAYRKELNERNPSLSKYIEKFASEPRLKALQTEIVSLESRRDLALANTNLASEKDKLLSDYNARIASLRSKLDEQLEIYKSSVFATTPEELKDLSLKIFEEDVKNSTLEAALIQLKKIVADYEAELDQLPERTLDLARLERNRVVLEKLYLLVEEKYQEALINEQSTPGNVQVIDRAIVPANPSKPNRQMIILVGLVLGIGLGFAFAFVKEYF